MGSLPENALQIEVSFPLLNAGLFRARVYPYGVVPKETGDFIKLACFMKRELNSSGKVPYKPKLRDFVAVYCAESDDWHRGYVTRVERIRNGLLTRVFLIDHGEFLENVTPKFIQPLPSKFDVHIAHSQSFKVALFGVVPAEIHIGLLRTVKTPHDHWFPEQKQFVEKKLKHADKIYFQEICQRDEIRFGYVYIREGDSLCTLQNILIESRKAIACDDELEFMNKNIPALLEEYRGTAEFDNKAAVRKRLYPNFPVATPSEAGSRTPSRILSSMGSLSSLPKTSSEDNISVASRDSSNSGNHADRSWRQYNDRAVLSDRSEGGRTPAQELDEAAFSDSSSESETSVSETGNFLNVLDDPTLRSDPNYHVDDVFVLGRDADNYFCATSQLHNSQMDTTTKEMLDRLKVRDLVTCQKYMIPAMMTGKNVTLVDSPKSGKTAAYLMPLVSLLRRSPSKEEPGFSPRAVIVCPYSSRCESIHNECWRIITGVENVDLIQDNDQSDLRVNWAYGCGSRLEDAKLRELTKGYDVLVCTPRCLLRLILKEKTMFDLKKLDHLIFDEFHILLESYFPEVKDILQYVHELKKRHIQRVIVSNYWNAKMKSLVEADVKTRQGFVLMPCYLEAALYVHLISDLKFLSNEQQKLTDICDLLNHRTRGKSVVIVLGEDDDFHHVFAVLNKCGRSMFKISNLMCSEREISLSYREEILDGHDPVLICTDYTLARLRIYEADCLIHYSLPHLKSDFNLRFSVLLNRLQAVAKELLAGGNTVKKPETYIYVNTNNQIQFPMVLDIMKKLHAEVPETIKTVANRLLILKETKNKKDQDICVDLRQFGRCANEKQCGYRHVLTPGADQPDPSLPKSGHVQVHITYVYSPTHFRVRLLKHKDANGQWAEVPAQNPGLIQIRMGRYLRNPANVRAYEYTDDSKDDIVAVNISRDASALYKRAKILKITEYSSRQLDEERTIEKPRSARVMYIDSGEEAIVKLASISKLPEDLASLPAATVDVFICNLLPIDEDNTWGQLFRQLIDKEIQACAKDEMNKFVGKIQLVIGRNLWLDPFGCYRYFDAIKQEVLKFSVTQHLLQEKLAVKNELHLVNLRKRCVDAGFLDAVDTSTISEVMSEQTSARQEEPRRKNVLEKNSPTAVVSEGAVKSNTANEAVKPNTDTHVFRKPAPVKPEVSVKPLVMWRQDDRHVYMIIKENIDEPYKLICEDKRIIFEGKMGSKTYKFDECLFACVDDNVEHRKSGVTIFVKMLKLVKQISWRRLLRTRAPQRWIKLDQSTLASSDESDMEFTRTPDLGQYAGTTSSRLYRSPLDRKLPDGFEDCLSSELESDDDSKYCD